MPSDTKKLIVHAVDLINRQDYKAFVSLLREDVEFTVEWSRFRPFRGREAVARLMAGTFSQFRDFAMTIDRVISEDEWVVELSHGEGFLADGTHYTNSYSRVWRVVDQQIVSVNEFMDTARAEALTARR